MNDPQIDTRDDGAPHAGRFRDAPIGAAKPPRGVRWLLVLVIFMRLTAVVWLARGLHNWVLILGVMDDSFTDMRLSRQAVVIAMAAMDLIAAVGLWLVGSWGPAVWLLVLIGEAALPFLFPDLGVTVGDTLMALSFGLIYLFLLWKTYQDEAAA